MKSVFEFGKEWREIPEFAGYFASADGEILSLVKKASRPRILKQQTNGRGYRYVFLYRNKEMSKMFVHRAVLMSWVRMPEEWEEGRHLNDNPNENSLENLAWGSRQDNVDDKRRNGRIPFGESVTSSKLTEDDVTEIRRLYGKGISSQELAELYHISKGQVMKTVRGGSWSHLSFEKELPKHSSKRKTPMRDFEIQRGTAALLANAQARRKPREMIPCACGCGTVICSVNERGRSKKYVKGHNQRNKHWRWNDAKD